MLSCAYLCVCVCALCVRFGLPSTEAAFKPQLLLNCNIVWNRSNNWVFSPLILLQLRCLNKSFQQATICSIDKLWKRDANYGFAVQENSQRGREIWEFWFGNGNIELVIVSLYDEYELRINKIFIMTLLKTTVFIVLSPQRLKFLYAHTSSTNCIYISPKNYSTSLVHTLFLPCHAFIL